MTDEDKERQRQLDHDNLIEVKGRVATIDANVNTLNQTVGQNNLLLQKTVEGQGVEINNIKLKLAQVDTGIVLTRWIFGALLGILTLSVAIYEAFK